VTNSPPTHPDNAAATLSEQADLLIRLGCVQYSGKDTLRNYQRAYQLLELSPTIAEFSFYSALVSNKKQAVQQHLQLNPRLANTSGGPLNWPALLYATYSRINEPSGSQQSIEIIQLLLDNGADPNSHVILNDAYRFTALTGVMGEGEQGVNQPPHQYADELAKMLLEAGANPNDSQGLYNTMFTDSGDKWLAILIKHGLSTSHKLNWDDPHGDPDLLTLNYQLASAINSGYSNRTKMLLTAGANPNTVDSYNGKSVHTNALLRGNLSIAYLLIESGAIAQQLSLEDRFRLACVNADDVVIVTLLDQHPYLKNDASLLHDAVDQCDKKILRQLIELGFDVNGQADSGRTLLHNFALSNDTEQIGYLLNKGADFTIRDKSHSITAAGFAAYSGSNDALHLLLDRSDNFFEVVCCAYLARARILLTRNPELAVQRSPQGHTALHIIGVWLPEEVEHDTCEAFIELLLASGADIQAQNDEGRTPVEFNRANGAEIMADLLSVYSH
jgi:ankyrin repeat protein